MGCRGTMCCSGVVTVLGLGLLIASVATTHWVDTLVDRDALAALNDTIVAANLPSNPIYFTRYRGMFTTCYDTNNSSAILAVLQERGAIDDCVADEGITTFSTDSAMYDLRNHLLRTAIACALLCLILVIVGVIVQILGQCEHNMVKIRNASLVILFAGAFNIIAMGLMTTIKFVEEDEVDYGEFPANWRGSSVHVSLKDTTEIRFWYSFFMGWASAACFPVAAITMWAHATKHRHDPMVVDWVKRNSERDTGYNGPSFSNNPASSAPAAAAAAKKPRHSDASNRRRSLNTSQPMAPKNSIYSWGYAGSNKSGKTDEGSFYTNSLMDSRRGYRY